MSVTAYARHRGVSRRTVYNWLNAGKIAKAPDGQIDEAAADRALDANNLGPELAAPKLATGYALAREEHERTKAEMARLKLRAAQGELVDAERVRTAWFEMARTVRDRILSVPDRVCVGVAELDDPEVVRGVLVDELKDALEALADEVQGLAP